MQVWLLQHILGKKKLTEQDGRMSQKAQWAVVHTDPVATVNTKLPLADHELIRAKNRDPTSWEETEYVTSTKVNSDLCASLWC